MERGGKGHKKTQDLSAKLLSIHLYQKKIWSFELELSLPCYAELTAFTTQSNSKKATQRDFRKKKSHLQAAQGAHDSL